METIKGVIINKLSKYEDQRGWLSEIHREDEDNFKPAMGYISFTAKGQIRGPHEHKQQTDFFVFMGPGNFELYLWDARINSETYDKHIKTIVGEDNKCKVIVPPGVVHGYKCISDNGSLSINLPDKLYKGKDKIEEIDEIRHEDNPDSRYKIQ